MAKKRPLGRPAAFEVGTKLIRVPADLADMVAWLARVEGTTHAQIVDPLVRPSVKARFAMRFAQIMRIKEAEDAAAVANGREPSPPLPTFTTVDPITGDEVSAEQAAKSAEVLKKKPKK